MYRYSILSIDGGGTRGVMAAKILERIKIKHPYVMERTDLLAGTSTGGIICLGLAYGLEPKDMVRLYVDKAKDIFWDSTWNNIKTIGSLIGSDYDGGRLRSVLQDTFGDVKLCDLKKHVLIPTFKLDGETSTNHRCWKPKFFHNLNDGPDIDEYVVDVAMRTSSAPIYFPAYGSFIDGGVVCNNPTIAALAQALDKHTGKGSEKLPDITVLSLGTGIKPEYVEKIDVNWGLIQWARSLVSIFMDGANMVTHYQAQRLLGKKYHRVQIELDHPYKLDEVENVQGMVELASSYNLKHTNDWVKTTY